MLRFALLGAASLWLPSSVFAQTNADFFERRIRPLLVEKCFTCHSAQASEVKGRLRVDSRQALLRGGGRGPALVAGAPEQSLLIRAVRRADPKLQMPPEGSLSAREIADLEAWVRAGASWPAPSPLRPAPGSERGGGEGASLWSLRPITKPALPPVKNAAWLQSPIDAFILARLETAGMKPAAPADRITLIRRATFDLIGLPPTPEEVDAFVHDAAPRAFEKVIDRLLTSPHYGERWGRHWLDVVRYADTSGCNADVPIPEAWRYRNYVIDAFNRDLPYDRFLREQIAGDLLPAASEAERHRQTIATGYLALSRRFSSLGEEPHLTLEDTIDNLGKAMLGLSTGCARCHDHKYDPIPMRDYYALYGIFESTRYAFPGTEIPRHSRNLIPLVSPEEYERVVKPFEAKLAEIDREIDVTYARKAALDTGPEKNKADARWKDLTNQRDAMLKAGPRYERAFAVAEGTPHDACLHRRGDPKKPGEAVPRGFLTALGAQRVQQGTEGSGRRELADWLTEPGNPLTARVMVNRIWQHHFGQGLVRSPNDFGMRGQPPTHPELLDYLAIRFVESGWSVKAMHKLMMLSAAYQQGSGFRVQGSDTVDPDNKLLSRFPSRRLSAEELRDAMLALSGALERGPGGPHPFKPEIEWRYTQHNPFIGDFDHNRRSVYLLQQRIRAHPFLGLFDGADPNATTGQRTVSTTTLQALFLMNNAFSHRQADLAADRVLAEAGDTRGRIERAYRLCFARRPQDEELRAAEDFLRRAERTLATPRATWASLLRVLMSSNEFVVVD